MTITSALIVVLKMPIARERINVLTDVVCTMPRVLRTVIVQRVAYASIHSVWTAVPLLRIAQMMTSVMRTQDDVSRTQNVEVMWIAATVKFVP